MMGERPDEDEYVGDDRRAVELDRFMAIRRVRRVAGAHRALTARKVDD